jgi:hypothetical protein
VISQRLSGIFVFLLVNVYACMAFYIVENDATSSIKVHGKAEDGEAA